MKSVYDDDDRTDHEDYYVTPTCSNIREMIDNMYGINHEDQVFVFYEFNEKQWIANGWMRIRPSMSR